ncbi:chromatin remodelling complex Rsc7/Swp82 subunit-domain-containing protein [Zopfochytrium polystomum]|nr:chromatin remodelling complex Rsc7/Swp82 subunit-domain-containing protein [Zopfochytrium polystomum]
MDEDGNITDEDSTGPSDPLGDEKINSDGTLRGGRRYQIRTFTLPRYPNRLYMLTMDLSKCLGFRDSYLFYLRNPELKRINATAADKESLLERNLLAPVLKGRPLGIMTARSAFKLFGHAVIFGGRPVRDDYYCTGKEEPVQSGTTGQGHGEDSNALAKVNLNIKVVDKASSPALLRAAASASEFNALLAIQRRGKKFLDIHTNIDQVPLLTQPTTIVIEKSPDFALPPGDRHTMTVDLQAENEEDQQASDGMICMKIDEETARNYPIALTAGQYQAGYSVPSPSKATGAKIGRPRIHPLPPNKGAKASPNPTASNLTTATNHGAVAVGPASQPPRPAPPPRPPTPDPNACCLCESVPPPAKLPDGTRGRPNADPPSLLACAKCKLKHHPFCADIRTPVMVAKTRQYKWCCGNCKVCDKCGKAGEDERLMVLCDACDRGYHTYCLDPPLKEPPSGTWHCPSCATCISCGRHQTPSSKWFQATFPPEQEDFAVTGDVEIYAATYCAPCGKLYENKSYCPLCFHVYHEDAEDLEMACCDECDRWIHVNCDPLLTDALYRRLTTQSSTPYTCALCDPSRLDVLIAKRTKETSTKKSGLGGGEVFRRIETGGKVVVIPPLVERKEDVVPKG